MSKVAVILSGLHIQPVEIRRLALPGMTEDLSGLAYQMRGLLERGGKVWWPDFVGVLWHCVVSCCADYLPPAHRHEYGCHCGCGKSKLTLTLYVPSQRAEVFGL